MGIGELSRMGNIEPYQLEYDLKEKQFYVSLNNKGRISVHELIYEQHEFHWKERKMVDSILKWLKENHPEFLI